MVEPNNLNYGHFGAATYDLDNAEWVFSRNLEKRELLQLGSWRTVIPPATRFRTPALPQTASDVHNAIKRLARDCPDIAPAVEQLAELDFVSAAIITATNTYDSTVGDLLAFGSITCHGHSHQPKRVVATATGEVGNVLRLQVISKERHGWGNEGKGVWVEGPSIAGHESGYWNEEAAPIQQICFAQTEERSSFLAVRLPSRTILFQPTYVHRRKAIHSEYFDLPPSGIDARPILSITNEDTSSVAHADVAFNPNYQRQFGIVDQRGNWSVWDIDHGYHFTKYSCKCSTWGSVVAPEATSEEPDETDNTAKEDGWARILWAGDANTIVVANRRRLAIINFKNGLKTLKCPTLIPKDSADWILDVQRHPSNQRQIFVLSSTRLYLLSVTCPSDDVVNDPLDARAEILVSWTHYRGEEDVTLQLCTQDAGDDVAIHSHLNKLVTVYRFAVQTSGRVPIVSASDPFCIKIQGLERIDDSLYIRQMYIDRLSYGSPAKMYDRGLGNNYEDADIQFHRLSLLLSDLSVRQVLLHVQNGKEKCNRIKVEPASWVRTIRPKPCSARSRIDEDDADDGFVEPDGRFDANHLCLKSPHELPRNLERRKIPAPWYFSDYRTLYGALVGGTSADGDNTGLEIVDIDFVVREVKQLLAGDTDLAEPPLGTLLEYAGCIIAVKDIDEASAHMQELFSVDNGEHELKLKRIAEDPIRGLIGSSTQGPPTVLSVYDTILNNWIAPLPEDIPATVRLHKERLARRVAAEVILATARVRFYEELPDSQPTQSQDSLVPFPDSSSQPTFSQPATQSQFVPPAVKARQEIISSEQSQQLAQDPLSRLNKHLRIENPLPTTLPQNINRVLTHWQLGNDPNTYSWEATEGAIAEELESHDEASQQRREKAKRKQERRERRQRKENELFQQRTATVERPQMLRSSPGPMPATVGPGPGLGVGVRSSQMPTQGGGSQGLSQMFGGMVVQSQTVPGKHGARPAKKPKKKRKQGF